MSDRTQLLDKLLALPEEEREDIALRLLDSLGDGSTKEECSAAWREELACRLARYESGETSARPWEDVLADARKMLKEGTKR